MWNDCRIEVQPLDADDVGFISALLDDVTGSLHIDEDRVCAPGYSNGAMMVMRLYVELATRLAATADNMPLPDRAEYADADVRKPIMLVFGTADVVVPYTGVGIRRGTMSAHDTIADWTGLLGDAPRTDDRLWPLTGHAVPDVVRNDGIGDATDSIGYVRHYDNGVPARAGVGPPFVLVKKILEGGHTQSGRHPFAESDPIDELTLRAMLGAQNRNIALADELYAFLNSLAMRRRREERGGGVGNESRLGCALDVALLAALVVAAAPRGAAGA